MAIRAVTHPDFIGLDVRLEADIPAIAPAAHFHSTLLTHYESPKLRAFNFVIERALGGGVTISLKQDVHGKSLGTVVLEIELPPDAG